MHKKVKISIRDGKVQEDYIGFQGKECEHLAARIAPGEMTEENKTHKPEYDYETVDNSHGDTYTA